MPASHRRSLDASAVVTKATLHAAEQLGLNNAVLGAVLGVSEASVSRLKAQSRTISVNDKEGELALMLIRIFRSLDLLVDGSEAKRLAWMKSHNTALQGIPNQLIGKLDGLTRTLGYLEGMRAATPAQESSAP